MDRVDRTLNWEDREESPWVHSRPESPAPHAFPLRQMPSSCARCHSPAANAIPLRHNVEGNPPEFVHFYLLLATEAVTRPDWACPPGPGCRSRARRRLPLPSSPPAADPHFAEKPRRKQKATLAHPTSSTFRSENGRKADVDAAQHRRYLHFARTTYPLRSPTHYRLGCGHGAECRAWHPCGRPVEGGDRTAAPALSRFVG
jgi:hypothetical protein